jgi:hypothetical protein
LDSHRKSAARAGGCPRKDRSAQFLEWIRDDGRLLVADSYNDALKWVDPTTRSATGWIRGLNEPGGVACGQDYAYVADTNAHRVVAVNYKTDVITSLTLE